MIRKLKIQLAQMQFPDLAPTKWWGVVTALKTMETE